MLEYFNTGVSEIQIGMPTEEERKWLEEQGYILFSNGKKAYEPFETYDIWLKTAKFLRGGVTITDHKPWIIEEVPVERDLVKECLYILTGIPPAKEGDPI